MASLWVKGREAVVLLCSRPFAVQTNRVGRQDRWLLGDLHFVPCFDCPIDAEWDGRTGGEFENGPHSPKPKRNAAVSKKRPRKRG